MSLIQSLSIQGIRSFGVKADDKQTLNFTAPLTLIVGTNGSGKTTIIECLKYALTGEVPPGTNRGQLFVHDPKIFNSTECLGQVQLLVKNAQDKKMTITRSLKLSYKRGKLSFETIDATLNFESDGQMDIISKRCGDADADMCQFMGVSKAIINNVIFCHQEDSSWPLDEGKKLKEKFDAIFGTTEYNKAIDKIMKLRKEKDSELKIKQANLQHLEYVKKETESKTIELQNAQKKLERLQEKCARCDEELTPINERLTKITRIELEIGQLQSQRIELQTKIGTIKVQISNLTSKIKNIFDGNIHLLDREIRNFHNIMEEKESELKNLEHLLETLKSQERKLQNNLTDLERKMTSLVHQRQQEQEYLSERANKIYELCSELKIPINEDLEHSNENIDSVLNKIKNAFTLEEKNLNDISMKYEKEDQENQSKIDKLREQKASNESDISSKTSQKSQLEKELKKLQNEISSVERSQTTLKDITTKLEKVEKAYNEVMKTTHLDAIKKVMPEKRNSINALQQELETMDEKLTFLNSISKVTAEIAIKEKEHEKRLADIKRIKSKHLDNFQRIFPEKTIQSNFKKSMQLSYETFQKRIKCLDNEINEKQLKERELQLMRQNLKEKISSSEKELENCKEKIFNKCRSSPYESLLAKCKENVERLRLEHGALKSAEAMYKKYIKKINDDPCCPLCHKNMSQNEATDLTSELSEEIHNLPDNIERVEKELKTEQVKLEELSMLKWDIEKSEQLEEEIPKSKTTLQETETKLSKVTGDIESLQLLTVEPKTNMDLVNSMLGDMSLLDEGLKNSTRIEEEIAKLKEKLPEGSSSTSLESVQSEKTKIAEKLKAERSELEKLQAKYDKDNDIIMKLREEKNTLKGEQIKLQEGVQALSTLNSRKEEIIKQITLIDKEISDLQLKMQPIKNQLESAQEEKKQLKEENQKQIRKLQTKLNSLKMMNNDIERYTKDLKELAELNLSIEIDNLKNRINRQTNEHKTKNEEKEDTLGKIEKLRIEISNQEILERDLKDNKELKTLQKNLEKDTETYEEIRKDMGDLEYGKITKEKTDLNQKRDVITVKKSEIQGQLGEINNQVNKIQNELNDKKFKDSVKNYRKAFYDVEITKRIKKDLGEYRIALEHSLMVFHSEKMTKINRYIRELWRQIYKGNDIDFIEIQTDEMKTDNVDKKRSYNYRVVQSKNGSLIDMRGRCSAGQRVLASLIIRMALAETFSSNCGVLALDEPTTNLDRINVTSLCEALCTIIEERQAHNNFMLIVITHDEDFISMLGRIRNYHKVFRSTEGKSVIRKVRIV